MIRPASILFWFCLVMIASIGLYRTSGRVQELDRHLRDVNAAIEAEKQNIHVLKAEWVYLANPARIEAASKRHLALRPTAPQQVATLGALSEVLPTRGEAMAAVAVNATPVASVKTSLAALPPVSPAVKIARSVAAASAEHEHLRDHMLIQRTASAAPLPGDSIAALIGRLNAGR